MRKPVALCALLVSTLFIGAPRALEAGLDIDEMRASVVQVFVTSQSEDYYTPWQRPRAQDSGGSAFYIGDNLLMTNAHVVSDARNLEIKRADRAEKYPARVVFAGHDCDLAVITTDDASFFENMRPLEVGARPLMRSKVHTVGYPMGGTKLSITEGVVSRIEVRTYVHSGADDHLTIQTDAAINPGNSGGPVFQGDKVVGVAFQGQFFSQSIGYMIPPSVIRHFLTDIEDGEYHGYPELGIYSANLENKSQRAYLGVPDGETGVLVLKPMPYASCVGHLQRNDVLHRIDGHPIQNDGTIRIDGDFFEFTHVVEDKQIGETVTLTIRRDGKVIEVPITLQGWEARMTPASQYDTRPEYAVVAGYVFAPVTANYLSRAGRNNELSYYYQQYYRLVAKEGETREQLVVLSRVLPDPSTNYRSYRNAIVEKVNGTAPNDFAHFIKLLDAAVGPEGSGKARVEFEGVNVAPLILFKGSVAKVHDRICKRLGITEDRYVHPSPGEAALEGKPDEGAGAKPDAKEGGK